MLRTAIVGASGYTGGELLRLLLRHSEVKVQQATSNSLAGKPVTAAHPNLRRQTDLQFTPHDTLAPCDLLFVCTPHGTSMKTTPQFLEKAGGVIDLSADFRLKDPADYPKYYGHEHPHPELLPTFVYGVAELHRSELKGARRATGPGCLATASNLALKPLLKRHLVDNAHIVVDAKVGSSAVGAEVSPSTHHPDRAGVVRAYAATGHRHTAEIEQEMAFGGAKPHVSFSAHAVELVRGILATCHVFLTQDLSEKDIWKIYREEYGQEPFVRIVKEKSGVYRYPEPKLLHGSNFADVGFEKDPHGSRVVLLGAIDNLMKGAAGSAVQAMNIMYGFDERTGLGDVGLHPI